MTANTVKGRDNTRGTEQCKTGGSNPKAGHHSTHPAAIQRGHHANGKGDASTRTGGSMPHYPPFSATPPHFVMPPTIHNAPTLHHDEGGADRGYPTARTPRRNTHPHTPHDLARNSARHDRSTDEYCTGMSGARAIHTGPGGPALHTPPPFRIPRTRGRTPSTHPFPHRSCSHDQRITMINDDQ